MCLTLAGELGRNREPERVDDRLVGVFAEPFWRVGKVIAPDQLRHHAGAEGDILPHHILTAKWGMTGEPERGHDPSAETIDPGVMEPVEDATFDRLHLAQPLHERALHRTDVGEDHAQEVVIGAGTVEPVMMD